MFDDGMRHELGPDIFCSQALSCFFKEGYRYALLAHASYDDLSVFEMQLDDDKIGLRPRELYLADNQLQIGLSSAERGKRIFPKQELTTFLTTETPKIAFATEAMLQNRLTLFPDTIQEARRSYSATDSTKEKNRAIVRHFFTQFLHIDYKRMPKHCLVMDFISDYTVVDIETTGLSPTEDTIIELAALRVRNHQVVASYSQLINPQRPISSFIRQLTGIDDAMVKDQPTLCEAAALFVSFIGNDILVGHNIARFDALFLNHQIPYLSQSYKVIDTLMIARKVLKGCCPNMKLSTIADFFSLEQEGAHRALNDTIITQACYEKMALFARQHDLSIESSRFQSFKASDFKAQSDCHKNSPLSGKIFVITGSLGKLERKDAYQAIVDLGGIVKDSVVKNTDYVVVGDWDGPMTSKQQKALAMQRQGHSISILNTGQFLSLIGCS